MWDDIDLEEFTSQYIKKIQNEEEIEPTTLYLKRQNI